MTLITNPRSRFILTLVEVTIPVAFNPTAVAPTPKADEIPEHLLQNPKISGTKLPSNNLP